ncbi:MAG: hypothetical protein J6P20_02770, partial [Oscillospiraceae bacterium]|nr:hypothetical protein [Oscillospiraceae bacterium]
MARFVFMDDEGGTIEEYLIDMLTGVGTDSKGETVDLAAFAETHEIENSDYGIDDSGVDESGYFAPSGLISHFAAWDYYEKTGKAVNMTQFSVDEETMIAQIVLSGEEGQLDTYTIDVTTGIGTNQNGDEIDLSVYAETEGSEEDDYIQELMAKLAQKDYQLKTGTEVSGLAWWPGDEEGTLIVTLTDEDDNTLDVYTVQTATGDAVNQAGDQINLNALCPSEEDFFVRSDDIEEYAKMYFIEQNGMEPAGVVADFDVLENTLLIQFVDEASEPIDAYTIDIATGIGHDAVGEAVDLAAYAEAHKIVHWEDEADESEFAAPAHTMLASALYDYCCKYGVEAYTSGTGTDIAFSREPMIVFVRFTSQNGAAEEYTIDFKTGSAVNSSGETVDLLPYALKHEDYLEEALSGMGDYASKDYYL